MKEDYPFPTATLLHSLVNYFLSIIILLHHSKNLLYMDNKLSSIHTNLWNDVLQLYWNKECLVCIIAVNITQMTVPLNNFDYTCHI